MVDNVSPNDAKAQKGAAKIPAAARDLAAANVPSASSLKQKTTKAQAAVKPQNETKPKVVSKPKIAIKPQSTAQKVAVAPRKAKPQEAGAQQAKPRKAVNAAKLPANTAKISQPVQNKPDMREKPEAPASKVVSKPVQKPEVISTANKRVANKAAATKKNQSAKPPGNKVVATVQPSGKVVYSNVALTDDDPKLVTNQVPKVAVKPKKTEYPEFSEMPDDFRRELPRLDINVHVYSEEVSERFVLIKMERYQEGDRLPAGVVIKRITEDGMVLTFQGRTFHYTR